MVLLGQLNALRIDRQRQMNVIRRCPAKLMIQRYLSHRRFDQICPAHNFRDALETIVDDHGQVIGEKAVAAVNNKILAREALISMDFAGE